MISAKPVKISSNLIRFFSTNKEKILIVFHSRSGNTKKIAQEIQNKFKKEFETDLEEIKTEKRYSKLGIIFAAGKDAMTKKLTNIAPPQKDVSQYSTVVVGTPIWAWTITPAVRTYLESQKKKFKKTAFFCTFGSSGDQGTFQEMKKILNLDPISTLPITRKELRNKSYEQKMEKFIEKIKLNLEKK
ncbi:exported protein-related [Anaeramoeba ignava]|uniref:Exported protein-related n=1 Tax=Anaeramoeba ignava TaxID=1746090 RepID=A0A9Q0R9K2_ANAIG|nr:exported protein-related [Anaeramoeba ignava]